MVAAEVQADFGASNRELMEIEMSTNIPVLPIAGGALVRVFASLVAVVTYWLKIVARARRHRREAAQLAKLDRRMLADIGITRRRARRLRSRSGKTHAAPRERAIERRMNRCLRGQ